jgi:uncharacterized iron-regulated protein
MPHQICPYQGVSVNRLTKNLLYSFFIMLGGCSYTFSQSSSETPYLPTKPPEIGDILHTATGHYIDQQQFYSSLTRYPLVYIGELHDNPASHRLQLEILKAMLARHPGQVVLGMEMFNNEQQKALDQWVAGELNEKEFLRESRWFENWAMDFALYRELLQFSRDQQIPVIGLNVPKALGRKVSMTPLDQLDQETSEQLPEMDMNDPYQRLMIEKIFGAHAAGGAMLESFFRRQTLWDETMAATVADYMLEHPEQHMVIIAGGWHVRYGFGIPRRVHRRLPLPYVLVGAHNLVIPEEKRDQLMDVHMPDFPMRAVDYLVFQEYEVFRANGVKLGVMLDDSDDQPGVLVTDRVSDSVAAKAGINKGDRLLSIAGVPIEDSFDLVYAVKAMRPGDSATIELKRGDETLVVEASFQSGQ